MEICEQAEILRLRMAIQNVQVKLWKMHGCDPRNLEILRWLDKVLEVRLDEEGEQDEE